MHASVAEQLGSPRELATMGLTHLSLDDSGPLLGDAIRHQQVRAAIEAGLKIDGAAVFGRGETEAQRLEHLAAMAEFGIPGFVLRTPGWRQGNSDGSGTAADWIALACWTRQHTSLDILCPWQTEGLAVLQVALQSCADGVEPLIADDNWEHQAWELDRAVRDAGFEVERIGMPTPAASRTRVVRRPDRRPRA